MRKSIRIYMLLALAILSFMPMTSLAQGKATFIIAQKRNSLYGLQDRWITFDNDMDMSRWIRKEWKARRMVISSEYTGKDWITVTGKRDNLIDQSYKTSGSFPGSYIKDKWSEGFMVTSLGASNQSYQVIVSKTTDIKAQRYKKGSLREVRQWFEKQWDDGYFITDMVYMDGNWCVISSRTGKYRSQGYFYESDMVKVMWRIEREVWDEGYCVMQMHCDRNGCLVIYGEYNTRVQPHQHIAINPPSIKAFMNEAMAERMEIVSIGGGSSMFMTNRDWHN